ncbi:MAG: hypothetical protein FJ184_11765 [Gammaproteobacteria bacterium]|nr:hypothetical protein [Gammaproteobacteria bacterium]
MNFKLNLAKVAALSVVAAAVAAPPLLADQQVTGRAVRPGSTASPTLVEQNGAVNEAVPVDDANSGADAPASPAHSVPGTDIASGDNGTAPEAAVSMGAGGVMGAPATKASGGTTASPTLSEQHGAMNGGVPVDDANSGADAPASPAHSVPGTDIASGDNGMAPEAAASMGAGGVMSAPAMQGPLPGAGANPRAPSGKGGAVRAGQEGAIRQN